MCEEDVTSFSRKKIYLYIYTYNYIICMYRRDLLLQPGAYAGFAGCEDHYCDWDRLFVPH